MMMGGGCGGCGAGGATGVIVIGVCVCVFVCVVVGGTCTQVRLAVHEVQVLQGGSPAHDPRLRREFRQPRSQSQAQSRTLTRAF
jgi:hypothetical protein